MNTLNIYNFCVCFFSGTTSDTLCGEVTSDGTSTDVSVKVCIDLGDDTVLITISGPEDVWFGVGFDAGHTLINFSILCCNHIEGLIYIMNHLLNIQ